MLKFLSIKYLLNLIFFLIIPIVGFFSIKIFEIDKLFYLLFENIYNLYFFIVCLLIVEIIMFSLNVPTTPFLIFNISILKYKGFLLSLIALLTSSIIIYFFSKFLKLKFSNKKIILYKQKYLTKNSFTKILISRLLIPFYFHNLLCGTLKIKMKIFLFTILLADFFGLVILLFLNDIILN